MEGRPSGDLPFHRFMAEANGLAQLDVLDVLMEWVARGDLVQFVRDVQTGQDYPDLLAVPAAINGTPIFLDRLKLLYRFEEGRPC